MKNSGIERINTKKHIIITAALLVVAVGAVVAVLNKDKLLASKNETAETTDGYTGADFEFETYETDETVGEDYVDDFDQAAYDSDYYATVVTPADIEDQSIKDLAAYYSGYELYDLKAKIELEDKYEEYMRSLTLINLLALFCPPTFSLLYICNGLVLLLLHNQNHHYYHF